MKSIFEWLSKGLLLGLDSSFKVWEDILLLGNNMPGDSFFRIVKENSFFRLLRINDGWQIGLGAQ
jgi:hypothetical protein